MKKTMFTIITVVKNDLSGLKNTQNSIALQTNSSYEWIVIDGNSTDATKDYVLNDLKNNKCISENDNGIYDAMNKGICISTGEYVIFLNAGDVFSGSQVLEKIEALILKKKSNADMIFCGANLKFSNKIHYRPIRKIENYIWHGLPANHQATFFKLSLLNACSYSDKFKLSGDYYIVAKLFQSGAISIYYNQPIVDFTMGGFSYQNPCLAVKEAYMIQRDVLNISIVLRILSGLKRVATYFVVRYFYM
jgi:putative colanic acid biosynthesis glycosyltransferase